MAEPQHVVTQEGNSLLVRLLSRDPGVTAAVARTPEVFRQDASNSTWQEIETIVENCRILAELAKQLERESLAGPTEHDHAKGGVTVWGDDEGSTMFPSMSGMAGVPTQFGWTGPTPSSEHFL